MRRRFGIFDSGIGGLTVLKSLTERLPPSSYIYFGDTARTPYGPKSKNTIIRYSIENSIFLIEKKIDLLVLACNTASSLALDTLSSLFSIPVLGVIDPAVEKACCATRNGKIGIIGTKATIRSKIYEKKIKAKNPKIETFSGACPLFVPLIEEGYRNKDVIELVVRDYLAPLKKKNIDTLILACTHYPLLKEYIQKEVGREILCIDPGEALAEEIEKTGPQDLSKESASLEFFVSDDPERFRKVGERFFGHPLPAIKKAPVPLFS
jgi:glutamate racemase